MLRRLLVLWWLVWRVLLVSWEFWLCNCQAGEYESVATAEYEAWEFVLVTGWGCDRNFAMCYLMSSVSSIKLLSSNVKLLLIYSDHVATLCVGVVLFDCRSRIPTSTQALRVRCLVVAVLVLKIRYSPPKLGEISNVLYKCRPIWPIVFAS